MRWIGIVLAACFPGMALADHARCKALFRGMPDRIAGLDRVGTETYDQPELGFQTVYEDAAHLMSVYFYDMGRDRIDDAFVEESFGNAIYEIKAVAEMRGNRFRVERTVPVDKSETFRWIGSGTEQIGNRQETEFAVVGENRDCLVKVRFTARGEKRAGAKVLSSALGAIDTYVTRR